MSVSPATRRVRRASAARPTQALIDLLSVVATAAGRVDPSMTIETVTGSGRPKIAVAARTVFVVTARHMTEASYPEIAATMGRSNHSTAITAHRRHLEGANPKDVCDLVDAIAAEMANMPWPKHEPEHPDLDGDRRLQRKLLDSLKPEKGDALESKAPDLG